MANAPVRDTPPKPSPTAAKPDRPPGPPQHWLFGNGREFSADRLGSLVTWKEQYGDIVSARFVTRPIVFLFHPDLIEDVLVTQNRKFIKHYRLRNTKRTLGYGLLTSEGEFWRRQRKLAQPAFHRARIAAYGEAMVRAADRMLQVWQDGQTRDAQEDMMAVTLEIVAKTLFDAEVGPDASEAREAMETLMRCFMVETRMLVKLPLWVPTPHNRRVERAASRLDRIILRFIAERRKTREDRGDLLSMLLLAQDEESGQGMTDKQLRDEAMTLFMAGHETTANTLAWAWFLIGTHPEVEAKLHAEIDDVLGGRLPTVDDLPRLPYCHRVITETLRFYPTVWLVGREAAEPVELGGYRIPVGTTIFMSQWVVHRDPRWYDQADQFLPDRWLNGFQESLPRYAYFPFGGGPRICIGNNFSLMESVLLLATIAQRFRLELVPNQTITPMPSLSLRPAHGVKVVTTRRSPPGAG